jgi:hypothetical protein
MKPPTPQSMTQEPWAQPKPGPALMLVLELALVLEPVLKLALALVLRLALALWPRLEPALELGSAMLQAA